MIAKKSISSVCNSVDGVDNEMNTPISKVVNDSKKRKKENYKIKDYDVTVKYTTK